MIIREKSLCDLIETHEWFRSGTPKQFIKLLETNAQGADLHTLTGIIFACSENVSIEDIYDALKELEQVELDEYIKTLFLTSKYMDGDLMIDDPYICYEMV